VARARWILSAPSPSDAEIAQAATVLHAVTNDAPASAAARVLLARAIEMLGNLAGAEEQLRIASDLSPDDTSIALEIARLAQLQGRTDAARGQVERALARSDAAPEQLERAAYLLAVLGDVRRSADLLGPLAGVARPRRGGLVLSARLYSRLGQNARAVEICERLLASPDLEIVELAAEVYERAGRSADAASALERLSSMKLRPGDRELAMARYNATKGAAGEAREWFRRAVSAAPSRGDAWTAYATFAVSTGDADSLGTIVADPAAGAASEPVRFLAGVRPPCAPSVVDARLRSLVLQTLTDTADRPVLVDALHAASQGGNDPAGAADRAHAMRALADSHVRVLPLQLVAADLCAAAGDLPGACDVARRAATEFPRSAAAARMAAEVLAKSGRWAEALTAATVWRDLRAGDDTEARVFVAEATTRCGRPAEAVTLLSPLVPGALADAARNERLLLVHAASLARSGDAAHATETIRGLVRRSERWRALALSADPDLLGDAAGASIWLSACAQEIPADDAAGRVELARSWGAAWERFREPSLLKAAEDAIAGVTARPDPPAGAWFVAGALAQRRGDLEAARKSYASAIAKDPGMTDARNNLAVVLAAIGNWSDAVREAASAAKAAPRRASYRDTLAMALRKGGEFAEARASIEEAIRLEPANPAWQVSLAETLAESGDADAARTVAARVREMAESGGTLPQDVRERLERLRRDTR
jgi:tetratricopeptide (TPR) repeat protein